MPTYEYVCDSCNFVFEQFQKMIDEPVKNCPDCGKSVRRVLSGGLGISFKGSGFYSNDKHVVSATGGETKQTKPATPSPATAPVACSGCCGSACGKE